MNLGDLGEESKFYLNYSGMKLQLGNFRGTVCLYNRFTGYLSDLIMSFGYFYR